MQVTRIPLPRHQILCECLHSLQDDFSKVNFFRNFVWQQTSFKLSLSLLVSITRGNKNTIQSWPAPRCFTFLCSALGSNAPLMPVSLCISVSLLGTLALLVPLKVMLPDGSQIRFNKMQSFFPFSESLVLNPFNLPNTLFQLLNPKCGLIRTGDHALWLVPRALGGGQRAALELNTCREVHFATRPCGLGFWCLPFPPSCSLPFPHM